MRKVRVRSCMPLGLAVMGLLGLAGCRSESQECPPLGTGETIGSPSGDGVEALAAQPIGLSSPAFEPGGPIPAKYTKDGEDLSPPLSWSGLPESTKELALICDDPDAPRKEPWVHWVLYKIPADCSELPEGLPDTPQLDEPPGALQGTNSWTSGQTIGYRGPDPPGGRHRYFFKLYALDAELEIKPEADKAALLKAMSGHIVGRGELMGTYER